jgi:hypothetical protein
MTLRTSVITDRKLCQDSLGVVAKDMNEKSKANAKVDPLVDVHL